MDTATRVPNGRLLFRVEEAGEVLGFKRSKMFALIAQGRLRAVKIDGATRIPADELQAFVSRVKAEAGVAEPATVA